MTDLKLPTTPESFHRLVSEYLEKELQYNFDMDVDYYIRHSDVSSLIQALVSSVTRGCKVHNHDLTVYNAENDEAFDEVDIRLWSMVFGWHDVAYKYDTGIRDLECRLEAFSDNPQCGDTVYIELLTAFGLLKPRQVFTDEEYKDIFV